MFLCFITSSSFFTSFTFNSWFLHELKHKIRLLKVYVGVGFSIFDSVSLIFELTLLFNKSTDSLTLKRLIPFKIKVIEKPHTIFLQDLWFWTLDVSRTASYEITLIRPSVRLSVLPPVTKFSQDFSDIAHDDSWPRYLATDKARSF